MPAPVGISRAMGDRKNDTIPTLVDAFDPRRSTSTLLVALGRLNGCHLGIVLQELIERAFLYARYRSTMTSPL